MDMLLLGPIEARLDERPIELGPRKQRAVLAMLALAVDRTVSANRLAEGLWGEERPASAAKMVQLYVSRLRQALAGNGAEIVTRGGGYQLRLAGGEVDAVRFERLLETGRPREALALWRSEPLSDVAGEPFADAEIRRLHELRLQAAELAIDADLAAGRHAEVLSEIRTLLEAEPLRERLHAQHLLALYRCGRQGDALNAYRDARSELVTRIGVEPGPELRRLHEAILRQDTDLQPPTPAELPPELDTRTPLVGRDRELAWLRHHWSRVLDGAGGLVLVAGIAGIGKTRLAAGLAAEVLREHAAVVYSSGAPADAVRTVATTKRPTLLVLDDLDLATDGQRAALAPIASTLIVAISTSPDGVRAQDTLRLAPLGAQAVQTLVRRYAGEDVDAPVDNLLALSGGIPRRVHAATSEWAAARRLGDAAERIAAERPVLRAAEDELAGSVVELQAARGRAGAGAKHAVVCPFKGLAFFDVEDSEYFSGRERLVADLVARLTGAPMIGVVGASGSGKSSALRAGLLAALAAGVLPGSDRWERVLLRPGDHPLQALAHATAGKQPRVVAVDQFEELFTACPDEEERAGFVDALVTCTREPRRRVVVLVAVRADYYGRCAAYPELARLLGANHVLVGPMRHDELRRAIELPARRAGLRVEPDLVDALVTDVEGAPGALPLLSTSLLELWRHRDGRTLRLADYERAGGVDGAVAGLAERAYEQLSAEQRPVARRVLLRLAGEGEGDAVVRRRVGLDELTGDDVAEVLGVLADARLVTIGDGEAEVAHEALLREWPRLREWLHEDAEARRLHRHLIRAAHDWAAAGRDRAELYRGARLAAALDWNARHDDDLSPLEREFLAASRAAAETESVRQRRANRRLRALLGGVAGLLALAVVAGAVALSQRGQARRAALTADAQRVGAEAVTRDRLDHALLLARAGVDLDDSAATRGHLLAVLLRTPQALGILTGSWGGASLHYAAVSPDGRRVALAGPTENVFLFDAATRQPDGLPYRLGAGLVLDLKFSPDGRTLAVTGFDPENPGSGGLVDLVDARTHTRRLRIALPPFPEPAGWLGVNVLFAPNGQDLIVQQVPEPYDAVAGPPSVLRRFDGATGARDGPPVRVGRHQTTFMWSGGDRRRLFVTSREDDETRMLDAEDLRVLQVWPDGEDTGTVSADGSVFALGAGNGEVRVLDLRSGKVRNFDGGHDASVLRMRFTPDGRTLVTSGADGTLIVWDVARGAIRHELSGHSRDLVWGVDLSPDGRTAYSAGADARAFVWDVDGDRSLVRPFTAARPFLADDGGPLPRGLALSPDGRTLAIGDSNGDVELVDTQTLRRRDSFRALRGFVAALAFSPDGRLLAASGQHGRLTLWDAHTLRPLGELEGQHSTSQSLAFSPGGTLLAASEIGTLAAVGDTDFEGGATRVWDVRRRTPTGFHVAGAVAHAFSPDGRLVAVTNAKYQTEVRDTRSGRLVAALRTPELVRSVAFAPAGGLIATGHFDGTAQLWSTESWTAVGRRIDGHDDKRVLWMGFTGDGTMLATAGQDGAVQLVDVATQTPIGTSLSVEPDSFLAATLSPDGRSLFAVSGSRAAVRWNLDPEAWKQHACRVAGRALTPREWGEALPGRLYRPVCP